MAQITHSPGCTVELLEVPPSIGGVDVTLKCKRTGDDFDYLQVREEYSLVVESRGGFSIRNLKLTLPDGAVITIDHLLVTEFRIAGKLLPEMDGDLVRLFTVDKPPEETS